MRLEVKGIGKSFGTSMVLKNVDFRIGEGEIGALLGENGAGKSTLMNIIGGVYSLDAGEIFIDGKKVSFSSPLDSQKAGIAFIHQELNLIDDLTVSENMFLSSFPRKGAFLDEAGMLRRTNELFAQLGIGIDPRIKAGQLDQSHKQMVEIARALMSDASLIIMDEPTSSLPPAEIGRVFDFMRALKKKKISMIFISHKLMEVMEICDSYSVLRNGEVAAAGRVSETSPDQLAALMVGHKLTQRVFEKNRAQGEEILRLDSFSDGKAFRDISFTLHRGEVLGITGLLGDGRSEVFETLLGIRKEKTTGSIFLEGKQIRSMRSSDAVKHGIGFLPQARKTNGIFPDLSIVNNGTISNLSDYSGWLGFDTKAQKREFTQAADRLKVRCTDSEALITSLSGGNQQKVLLERWLLTKPKVLILDNPTQGVDVGAKEEIYLSIGMLAQEGVSIIVLSTEAQEIIRICDRALVMFRGRIMGELTGAEMNEQTIMLLSAGAGKGETGT